MGPLPGAPPWGRTFLLSFLLSVLGVAGVAVLTGSRISKPMRSLAAAAGRLGRGEEVGDLPESGPLEIRGTVRAFNLMRGRLDRYVRDRTAMLAAISHDLRTPITSLRIQAEFVEDEDTRTKILAVLDEMQRMAEDTLAFIREDMRREGTRTVDLHALVDSVAADLADLGHELAAPDSGRVLVACRPVALRRAFRNLLENAGAHGVRATARLADDGGRAYAWSSRTKGPASRSRSGAGVRALRAARRVAEPRHRRRGPGPCHRPDHHPRPRRGYPAGEPRRRRIEGHGRAARRRRLIARPRGVRDRPRFHRPACHRHPRRFRQRPAPQP
ncbi:MAG: HAMP domain-containing protein [Deltaproteobacteria bacterium]|nr:HAMP domain-containing protein [Deltaproteobacteria bacterium]